MVDCAQLHHLQCAVGDAAFHCVEVSNNGIPECVNLVPGTGGIATAGTGRHLFAIDEHGTGRRLMQSTSLGNGVR